MAKVLGQILSLKTEDERNTCIWDLILKQLQEVVSVENIYTTDRVDAALMIVLNHNLEGPEGYVRSAIRAGEKEYEITSSAVSLVLGLVESALGKNYIPESSVMAA